MAKELFQLKGYVPADELNHAFSRTEDAGYEVRAEIVHGSPGTVPIDRTSGASGPNAFLLSSDTRFYAIYTRPIVDAE